MSAVAGRVRSTDNGQQWAVSHAVGGNSSRSCGTVYCHRFQFYVPTPLI